MRTATHVLYLGTDFRVTMACRDGAWDRYFEARRADALGNDSWVEAKGAQLTEARRAFDAALVRHAVESGLVEPIRTDGRASK